jgi:hypothetical protein
MPVEDRGREGDQPKIQVIFRFHTCCPGGEALAMPLVYKIGLKSYLGGLP